MLADLASLMEVSKQCFDDAARPGLPEFSAAKKFLGAQDGAVGSGT